MEKNPKEPIDAEIVADEPHTTKEVSRQEVQHVTGTPRQQELSVGEQLAALFREERGW